MPNYVLAAERAARKFGVDPAIFKAMIRQESGFNPNARSPAGAQGIAQFMPGTAPGYGVNLHDNRVTDDLEGAAKYIAANLKRTGGNYHEALSIYNSGRPDGYQHIAETRNYVRTILANAGNHAPVGRGSTSGRSSPSSSGSTTRIVTTDPGVDNSDARRQALSSFLLGGGTDPATGQQTTGDILGLALQMRALKDVPAQTATVQAGRTASRGSSGASAVSSGSGPRAALSWAESKINDPGARETGGTNRGQLPDYLNARFGFGASGGQPWCAMFTSAAVTKGGAPASARTASVAQVRQKAMQGVGYQRGYIPGNQARPGDLILFGNAHIGMVKSNTGGHITYVGGNQSDAVTEGQVPAHGASIVRPKYGTRR